MRVYLDGVFDLFHVGHLACIRAAHAVACEQGEPELLVGIVSDADATGYKRTPKVSEKDRAEIVGAIRYVTRVVEHCPLVVTPEFLMAHGIDLVVHGFANDADREKQRPFFAAIGDKFREIAYTHGVSTTQLIAQLKESSSA